MLRSLFIIAIVAAISGLLSHLESAQAERQPQTHSESAAWVRTVDGWEPSTVLTSHSMIEGSPALHPLLVAGFQLGASVFVLLAFPYPRTSSPSPFPEYWRGGFGRSAKSHENGNLRLSG